MNGKYLSLAPLMAVGIFSIIACNLLSNLGGSSPDKDIRADVDALIKAPSDPIYLTIALAENYKSEAAIPLEGATLTATGPDGSVYALEIPPDALSEETLISVTPVERLTGLPIGDSPAYAVQLEPAGLSLYTPAILTITPPSEIPIPEQLYFGFEGEKNEFQLALPVVDSAEIQIEVLHFSGYGVTKGFLADIESWRKRLGGDVETRLQNIVAEMLARERQRQLLGIASESTGLDHQALFDDVYKQYEEYVIKPRLAAAGESCAAGRLALQTLLGIERQRQLMGTASDSTNPLIKYGDLFNTAGKVCLEEEYELCVEEHIIHRIVPVWLGIERQFQLLGMSDGEGSSALAAQARQLAEKCLQFELEFESTSIYEDVMGGGGSKTEVSAKVPLRLTGSNMDLSIAGQSALYNKSYEPWSSSCSVTGTRGGGTFVADNLTYEVSKRGPGDELGFIKDFQLHFFPGSTSQIISYVCPQSQYTSPPAPFWTSEFVLLHEAEMTNESELSVFIAKGWEVLGGELFARLEWEKEGIFDDSSISESGSFKLYHRPGN